MEKIVEEEVEYVSPQIADKVTKIVDGALQSICAAHRRLALNVLKESLSVVTKETK